MLAVAPFWLQVIDAVMLTAGCAVIVVAAVTYFRRAPLRTPAGVWLPLPGSPEPLHAAAALLAYFAVQILFMSALAVWLDPKRMETIGSTEWSLAALATDLAKLAVAGVLLALFYPPRSVPRERLWVLVGLSGGAFLASLPLTGGLVEAARALMSALGIDLPEHAVLIALQQDAGSPWVVLQLSIGAIVIAPLSEEVVFRGVTLDALRGATGRALPAVIGSALLFGAVHAPQPHAVVPLAALGALLGFVRVRTGMIWPCVLVHALFNARTIVFTLCGATNA